MYVKAAGDKGTQISSRINNVFWFWFFQYWRYPQCAQITMTTESYYTSSIHWKGYLCVLHVCIRFPDLRLFLPSSYKYACMKSCSARMSFLFVNGLWHCSLVAGLARRWMSSKTTKTWPVFTQPNTPGGGSKWPALLSLPRRGQLTDWISWVSACGCTFVACCWRDLFHLFFYFRAR